MADTRASRPLSVLAAAALGLTVVAAPASATDRDAAFGSAGELYLVREGAYGELFPGQGLADRESPALAIDVVQPDQTRQRLLVPGTESADAEDSASILFEDQSGTLFVLWQSRVNVIHSRLNLIGLRDGEWTAPVEISGNPYGWKSSPQLAVTRDSFRTEQDDGSLRTWTRTVAHLLWWEEGPAGEPRAHYTPVTFLDGAYGGWNPVYTLDDLALAARRQSLSAADIHPLARAPRIEAGRNGQSVVIGFVSAETGKLTTLAVEVLPGEISFIADEIRHQIIEIGRNPKDPSSLAEKVRHQIIEIGNRLGLHPSVPAYAALKAEAEILDSGPGAGLDNLAERVRHQIVEIGARMTDRGLDRVSAAQRLEIIETSNSGAAGAPVNLIRVVEASARSTPRTGGGDNALYLSRNGREVVASWSDDGVIYFRESRGQGWSETRPLRLGSELDLGRAREILERRADERSDE